MLPKLKLNLISFWFFIRQWNRENLSRFRLIFPLSCEIDATILGFLVIFRFETKCMGVFVWFSLFFIQLWDWCNCLRDSCHFLIQNKNLRSLSIGFPFFDSAMQWNNFFMFFSSFPHLWALPAGARGDSYAWLFAWLAGWLVANSFLLSSWLI